jgi:hypothetical protein
LEEKSFIDYNRHQKNKAEEQEDPGSRQFGEKHVCARRNLKDVITSAGNDA